MTTSPAESIAAPTTTERVPLRISLDGGGQSGHIDGAWWPQSRDFQTEAADLGEVVHQVGKVERLLFSRPDWDAVAGTSSLRRIEAQRGAVKVGSFPSDDTHMIIAKMGSGRRLRLVVVPSDTDPGVASTVMRQAADQRNTQSPSALLGLTGPDQSSIGFNAWDDGGPGH